MNTLFVCTANLHRSRTAEHYYQTKFSMHTFRSAGLSPKECRRNGGRLCSDELITWADIVYVMEEAHSTIIKEHALPDAASKIKVLGIEDQYRYMQPELIKLLTSKVELKNWL